MRRTAWGLAVALTYVFSVGVATQQPAADDMSWAFPSSVEKPFPEEPQPKRAPGSERTFTDAEIGDLMNAVDWYPDQHPTPPDIVLHGHDGAMACGSCHLMSGLGHPESSDLTGLTVPYMVQQLLDFKSGARQDPTGKRMNGIAADLTDEEMNAAAEYFASLDRRPFQEVIEAEMVPVTFLGNGRMRFVDPSGAMEPIAGRIITVPDDQDRARLRDPYSGFVNYVPVGSLARGKELVETGGGKTVSCSVCHGQDLKGQGSTPRLAGVHPVYTVRQLHWFKDGTRNGTDAPLMKPVADPLNDEDIVAIAAYLASLAP